MTATAALPPDAGDGAWAQRPASFDSLRKPLAIAMLGAAGAVGLYTVSDRIMSDSSPRTTAGAAGPRDHVAFKAAAVPGGRHRRGDRLLRDAALRAREPAAAEAVAPGQAVVPK